LNKEQIPHLLSGVFPPEADQPLGENPAERILSKPFIPSAELGGYLGKVRDKSSRIKNPAASKGAG